MRKCDEELKRSKKPERKSDSLPTVGSPIIICGQMGRGNDLHISCRATDHNELFPPRVRPSLTLNVLNWVYLTSAGIKGWSKHSIPESNLAQNNPTSPRLDRQSSLPDWPPNIERVDFSILVRNWLVLYFLVDGRARENPDFLVVIRNLAFYCSPGNFTLQE